MEEIGVAKLKLPWQSRFALGVFANFIGDAGPAVAGLDWNSLLRNLVPVIFGKLAGGA